MLVRCERDNTTFDPVFQTYPTGDAFIECHTCRRRYFKKEDGTWEADRKLTILTGRKTWDRFGFQHFGHVTQDAAKQVYLLIVPPKGNARAYNRGYAYLWDVTNKRGQTLAAEAAPVVVEEADYTHTLDAFTGHAYWFEEAPKKENKE